LRLLNASYVGKAFEKLVKFEFVGSLVIFDDSLHLRIGTNDLLFEFLEDKVVFVHVFILPLIKTLFLQDF